MQPRLRTAVLLVYVNKLLLLESSLFSQAGSFFLALPPAHPAWAPGSLISTRLLPNSLFPIPRGKINCKRKNLTIPDSGFLTPPGSQC